ncbi:protein Jumonji isoform X3 [Aricia agestis]|uniref:protein Jumonji isoform X3 n=1 Tax=Aricia agestis TaxID=91739 RepID=UPI001C20C0D6|nr:protein Jumonji isoform X3 [Aricia agestis]
MKAKQVHAQRKYAQGAHIPSSNPSTPLERRVETGAQNTYKVFYNNNDAKNLLDIVSFSNIHRHTQPIVLVKRLENTTSVLKREPPAPLHRASKPIENGARSPKREIKKPPVFSPSVSPPSKTKSGRSIKLIKKRLLSKRVRRSNRLRGKPSPVLKKTIIFKNKIKAKTKIVTTKRIIKLSKPPVNETNELDAVCPSTDDDEQPLTYFKKKSQQVSPKEEKEKKKPVPLVKLNRRKSIRRKSNDSEPTPTPEPPRQSTKEEDYAVIGEKKKPVPLATRRKSIRRKSNDSEPTPTPEPPRQSTKKENDAVTAEKKKPVPLVTLNRRKSVRRKSNDSEPTPTPEPLRQSTKEENDDVTAESNSGLYYGTNGIERWISESTKDITKSKDYKVPVLLQKKKKIEKSPVTRGSTTKTTSPPNNVCSSVKFIYLKDVMNASQDDIDGNCNNCTRCEIIKKVVELSKLVRDTRKTTRSNGLDVDPSMDTTVSAYTNIPSPRVHGTAITRLDKSRTSKSEDKQAFFMDLLPGSDKIVEVSWCKIPNRKDSLMSARLISKTNLTNSGDVTLANNETLLDKLLQLYKEKTHTENSTDPVDAQHNSKQKNSEKSENNAPSEKEKKKNVEVDKTTKKTNTDKAKVSLAKITTCKTSNVEKTINGEKTKQSNMEKVNNSEKAVRKQANVEKPTGKQANTEQTKSDTSTTKPANTEKTLKQIKAEKPSKQTNVSKKNENDIPLSKIAEAKNEHKPARIIKRSYSVKRNISQDASTSESKKKKTDCNFPKGVDRAKLVDAPVFYPTEAEFTDPISYFEKVMPIASQFGICKVVPPPDFKPPCVLSDTNRFTVTNQYIPRLYTRWGPAFREMCAIRSYLASQKVHFTRAPLLEGLEVNLPKMYHTVQRLGGLKNVFDKKKWNRVAEEMHFYQLTNPSKKLEQIYVKYLLPYDTLTNRERQMKIAEVEQMWQKKNKKMLARAFNPLHRQKRLLGDSSSDSDSDSEPEAGSDSDEEVTSSSHNSDPLAEAEECIVTGRTMNLNNFEKVAQNAFKMYTPPNEEPNTKTIENLYWKLVLFGADHVCVNSASVDTGEEGYGFTKNKSNPYGKHPWNLKMISQNNGNLLRPLGPVLGLTVPTLHLGMIFSTSCWHRDPHALPWIEYMHQGPEKIWYGIPDEQSDNFRKAVEVLCPTVCQNKGIWLSSDITMIPPNMLLEHDVSLSKITQKPHEFVIVFPKAYSSSICTGYTISESVYFATQSWLTTMSSVFQELRESCEPTTFALEQLVMSVARDGRAPLRVLQTAHAAFAALVTAELAARSALRAIGLQVTVNKGTKGKRRLIRHQDECEICRTTLYLSKVKGVFGKQSALCVQHAMRVLVENETDLDDKKINKDNIELEIFFTKTELEEIEQNLQKRLLS